MAPIEWGARRGLVQGLGACGEGLAQALSPSVSVAASPQGAWAALSLGRPWRIAIFGRGPGVHFEAAG
eukprot:1762943-Pyramimonas_sp.AAC.1